MSTKKKVLIAVLGIEAVAIAAVIVFLFYMNSDTVKANRQLELAQRYLLEEDYEEAIAAFEVAIEIDPRNAEAYLGLAEAYGATDDIENVVKILERGVRRTDSEEIQKLLKEHTEVLEKRELAAQAVADASQTDSNPAETTEETLSAQQEETTPVTTGFITQSGEIYYYDAQRNLVTGWFDENSNRYCAKEDGRLYKDGEYEVDNAKYQFDSNGICLGEVADDAWKQAYLDYIEQKHKEHLSMYQLNSGGYDIYTLIYFDQDDIPELAGNINVADGYHTFIAYYSNGSAHCCYTEASTYIERESLILGGYCDPYSGSEEIVHFKNWNPQVIAEGHYSLDENFSEGEFEWNGVQLADWEEYERAKGISYDLDKAKEILYNNDIGYYTYEEIKDVIANW